MKIALIVAMAQQRVIGKDNDMPWHLPADLAHFKETTLGKPIIMGRKTFASIGRPLPGRTNVIMSRDQQYAPAGVTVVASPEEALAKVSDAEEVMVIGGEQIFELFLPLADTLYLTFIDADLEGDTWFPDWQQYGQWQECSRVHRDADAKNAYALDFVTLERLTAP